MLETIILIAAGLAAGLLSGTVGFGGSMILLPVITSFYGIEVAVPMATVAQLLSNIFRAGAGFRSIRWRKVGFFLIRLPRSRWTMLAGGGVSGIINGLLCLSGPVSSAVFMTLGLSPVAYIASEAASAVVMHIIQMLMYGEFGLLGKQVIVEGLYLGVAMVVGNYIAMKRIQTIKRKIYRRVVAAVMIICSIWLFLSV